jgi:hypothetical protein
MPSDLPIDFRNLLADKIQLANHIEALRAAYEFPSPISHVVMDNMFSEQILDALLPEISAMAPDQRRYVQ